MEKIVYDNFIRRLKKTALEVKNLGGKVTDFNLKEPATKEEVEEIESTLGFKLPIQIRDVFLHLSKSISFHYSIDNTQKTMPSQLKSIMGGILYLDLNEIPTINQYKNDLIDMCFTELDKELINDLRNTLAFSTVPNGDYIAIKLREKYPSVIYISHELDEMNGCVLAHNFIDFMDKLSKLCFIGPEDFQLKNFITDLDKGLDPLNENSILFREFMNFDLEDIDNDPSLDSYIIDIDDSKFDRIHDYLGDSWERIYIIKTQDTLTKKIHEMTIPTINGGILNKEMFESNSNSILLSFEEIINDNIK